MSQRVSEEIDIAVDPSLVYELVSDVGRMGEWSPEATGARGASGQLEAGDSFIGTNRRGGFRWFTNCRVRRAEPGVVFEFDVNFGPLPVARWCYEFERTPEGTRVIETWIDRRDGLPGALIRIAGYPIIPGDRADHNREGMRKTLRRLKKAAETTA
ncbi:MAG: SRPBCC family protein [Candidatus Nanopelagicales bacterium]|nr:SRPBCC family protein [Candidatus Nanopelagicales bacterium]